MLLRSLVVCCYLMGAYWASFHFPSLRMVFYPTLGAFSFLFMHRVDQIKDVGRITMGAIISVTLGSVMYSISHGTLSFFPHSYHYDITYSISKMERSPDLVGVVHSFFAHTTSIWALPIAVLVSLLGLIVFVWLIGKVEQVPVISKWSEALSQFGSKLTPTPTAIKKEL